MKAAARNLKWLRNLLVLAGALTGCVSAEPSSSPVAMQAPGPPRVTDVTTPGAVISSKVVYLDTRPGASQGFLFMAPEKPVASAILFAGGSGRIRLKRDGRLRAFNFLVRSRELFARRGIAVAVVDAASDIRSLKPVAMRLGGRHRTDIEAVMAFLRTTLGRPVWLVGSSRGALSAAAIAANSRAPIAGLVLVSSMTEVTDIDLGSIAVPAMVVANRNDGCRVTPPNHAPAIARALRTEALYFESSAETGGACGGMSEHGFLGIEEKVIDAIVQFMVGR